MSSDKKQLIESLKSAMDDSSTQNDIKQAVESVEAQSQAQAKTLESIKSALDIQTDQNRESAKDAKRASKLASNSGSSSGNIDDSELTSSIKDLIASFDASTSKRLDESFSTLNTITLGLVAAVGTVVAGFRGWEGKIITLGKTIANWSLKPANALIEKIGNFGKDIATKVKNLDGSIGRVVGGLSRLFSRISGIIAPLVKRIKSGLDIVTNFAKTSKVVSLFFRTFSQVFRKLLLPIGVLMSAFDGYKEAKDADGGMYTKITTFIAGFVGDFFGSFLDLVKDIIAYVAGAFGFDSIKDKLDAFSFEDTITNVLNGIYAWIGSTVTAIKDAVIAGITKMADIGTKIAQAAGDAIESVVSFVMEAPAKMHLAYEKWLLSKGATSIGELLWMSISKVTTWLTEKFDAVKKDFLEKAAVVKNIGSNIATAMTNAIQTGIDFVLGAPAKMKEAYEVWLASKGASSLGELIMKPIKDMFTMITDLIPSVAEIKAFVLSGLPVRLQRLLGGGEADPISPEIEASVALQKKIEAEDRAMSQNWARSDLNLGASTMPPSIAQAENIAKMQERNRKTDADFWSGVIAAAVQAGASGGSTLVGGSTTTTTNVTNVFRGSPSDALNAGPR